MSNILAKARTQKLLNIDAFNCGGEYQASFFKPYASFSDAKNNVKALAFVPLIDASLALHAIHNTLILSALGLANLGIGALTFSKDDLKTGYKNVKNGAISSLQAIYYTISIVIDTIKTLLRLITHTLSTIALGISKTAQAIGSCFESEPEQEQPNLNHSM